nr:hypothetical protein [Tanacetum cinerariifolium]
TLNVGLGIFVQKAVDVRERRVYGVEQYRSASLHYIRDAHGRGGFQGFAAAEFLGIGAQHQRDGFGAQQRAAQPRFNVYATAKLGAALFAPRALQLLLILAKGVVDAARNGLLPGLGIEVLFLGAVGKKARLDEYRGHGALPEHDKARLLDAARAAAHAAPKLLVDALG